MVDRYEFEKKLADFNFDALTLIDLYEAFTFMEDKSELEKLEEELSHCRALLQDILEIAEEGL